MVRTKQETPVKRFAENGKTDTRSWLLGGKVPPGFHCDQDGEPLAKFPREVGSSVMTTGTNGIQVSGGGPSMIAGEMGTVGFPGVGMTAAIPAGISLAPNFIAQAQGVEDGEKPQGGYPCTGCDKVYKHRKSMVRHYRRIHVANYPFPRCQECGAVCESVQGLNRHRCKKGPLGLSTLDDFQTTMNEVLLSLGRTQLPGIAPTSEPSSSVANVAASNSEPGTSAGISDTQLVQPRSREFTAPTRPEDWHELGYFPGISGEIEENPNGSWGFRQQQPEDLPSRLIGSPPVPLDCRFCTDTFYKFGSKMQHYKQDLCSRNRVVVAKRWEEIQAARSTSDILADQPPSPPATQPPPLESFDTESPATTSTRAVTVPQGATSTKTAKDGSPIRAATVPQGPTSTKPANDGSESLLQGSRTDDYQWPYLFYEVFSRNLDMAKILPPGARLFPPKMISQETQTDDTLLGSESVESGEKPPQDKAPTAVDLESPRSPSPAHSMDLFVDDCMVVPGTPEPTFPSLPMDTTEVKSEPISPEAPTVPVQFGGQPSYSPTLCFPSEVEVKGEAACPTELAETVENDCKVVAILPTRPFGIIESALAVTPPYQNHTEVSWGVAVWQEIFNNYNELLHRDFEDFYKLLAKRLRADKMGGSAALYILKQFYSLRFKDDDYRCLADYVKLFAISEGAPMAHVYERPTSIYNKYLLPAVSSLGLKAAIEIKENFFTSYLENIMQ